jgi:translation initiation factor 2 beta subunit (eIF-2beta)/eIF-5
MKEYISKRYGDIIHIFDPIYRENIWVLISPYEKDYERLYKQKFNTLPDRMDYDKVKARYSVCENKVGQVHIIWLKKFSIPELCHEVLHLVAYVLRQKETYLSHETDEVYAYYLEFLVRTIIAEKKGK